MFGLIDAFIIETIKMTRSATATSWRNIIKAEDIFLDNFFPPVETEFKPETIDVCLRDVGGRKKELRPIEFGDRNYAHMNYWKRI